MSKARIVAPDALSADEQAVAGDCIARAQSTGVFVGALVADSTWKLRPLLLSRGVLNILRFTEPPLIAGKGRTAELLALYQQISAHSTYARSIRFGESHGQFWLERPFYQVSLQDIEEPNELNLGSSPIAFVQRLLIYLADFSYRGVVHGRRR